MLIVEDEDDIAKIVKDYLRVHSQLSNAVELQLPTYHADYSSSEIKMINLQNETLADHVVDNCRVKKCPHC